MSKHLSVAHLYNLPSGSCVHPSRLIHKDGTIMWKHALINQKNHVNIPLELSHETHIIKTAQRLEELNSWVSQAMEPWECLVPIHWYSVGHPHTPYSEGYACLFKHNVLPDNKVFDLLTPHIQNHEQLQQEEDGLYFRRC